MKKKYIDIKKHWRKIKPFAVSKEGSKIWRRDLKKYHTRFRIYGHKLSNDFFDKEWFDRIHKFDWYFSTGKPSDYDSCDWRFGRLGRKPAFWDYVVHKKCHWMVNFNLFLAKKSFPKITWKIISSEKHSCVWDGEGLLFDLNYSALVPNVVDHPFYDELDESVMILPVGEELAIREFDEAVEFLDSYDEGKLSIEDIHEFFFEYLSN